MLFWSAFFVPRVFAQSPGPRPKIGLVLGGGGARGGAHVGVLKALQEQRIPIDYVAGTSMGAVVGALFALGLSPDEIDAEITSLNWEDLFYDAPDRRNRIFRRKGNDHFLPLEWGWRGGLMMPRGLVAGQKLSFAFRQEGLYLEGYQGFDQLSYPFRAVATDLHTGELFAPDGGNLMKMVRASLSIPGFFPPVRWNDRLLVDGYLVNNVPVDVCRQMGADIIIAVDVTSLPTDADPESFRTLVDVTWQRAVIFGRHTTDPFLADADLVIRPELEMATRDFDRTAEAIAPGYSATMAMAPALQELTLSAEDYAAHLRRHAPRENHDVIVSDIRVRNATRAADMAILENISQPLGQALDLDRLREDLLAIYDFGVFELVDFSLEMEQPGQGTLFIHAEEKHYAPHLLNFGASYYGGSGNQSYLDARVRWTWLELNGRGAELRTDLRAGQNVSVRSEFYQPLNWQRGPFLSLSAEYADALHHWHHDLRDRGDYTTQALTVRPELGVRFGNWGEGRLGFDFGYLRASDKTDFSLPEFHGLRGSFLTSLQFDLLDHGTLARRGAAGYLKYRSGMPDLGDSADYQRLEGKLFGARAWGRNIVHWNLEGGTSLDTRLPAYRVFSLGGLDRLTPFTLDQLRGQDYALGQLTWYRQVANAQSQLGRSWYLMVQLEAGNAWYDAGTAALDDLRYTGSIGLVVSSIVGQLTTAYGRSADGHDAAYITFGFWSRPLARGKS